MSPTLGLVGDLCVEAEWIWRRVCSLRRSMERCSDLVLLERLRNEVQQYVDRCLKIKEIKSLFPASIIKESYHWIFLNELTNRTLQEVSIMHIH